jgi:hypothetical protein
VAVRSVFLAKAPSLLLALDAVIGSRMAGPHPKRRGARRKARKDAGLEVVFAPQYGKDGIPEPQFDAPDPEDEALSRTIHSRALARASDCIADDFELQLLVEGLRDGKRGKELEELLSTDAKGLAAEPGDRIFLIGFSRGAYTVRSLANLLRQEAPIEETREFPAGIPL